MSNQIYLKLIFGVSVVGVLFSGYLSYREFFMGNCDLGFVSCGSNVAGLPACVYGLVMYLVVLGLSVLGLKAKE